MQHHPDEFSVTDIRHAVQEGWRVVGQRRWFLIFPFCLVSTIALICSLWLPRQYTARTVIKREQDPVFATMMGASWTQPYTEIRNRMLGDLQNEETIALLLTELDLPRGLERFEDGELSPQGLAARSALAATIAKSITTDSLSSSPNCDVVAINLTMSDSAHLAEILRAIRDRYVSAARRRTVDVLRDVQQFYQTESDRCREEVSKLQKALVDFELRYPGVNPDFPDPNRTEQTTLMVERLGLEKKLDELKSRSERLVERIAKASEKPGQKVESTDEAPKMQPNPRYAELGQEIARLQREIAEKKTLRGMTEQHPAIQQLRATMAMRQEELANTPGEIPATASSPAPPTESGISLPERLRRQLSDNEAEVTAHKTRLATINEQIADIERARAMAVENRQDYLKVRQQADSLDTELKTWQANIDAIQHIFTVEDRNRTIHFTTVKDVLAAAKPVSPLAAFVVAICLAIGAAAGVLCVLMAELVDRSYRTVKQLRTSLGIPVIESINEIVTAAVRRQRLIRHFVVMPAAALLCAGAMTVAAAMAYLSIESPAAYARMKSAPVRAVQAIQEPG